MTQVHTLRFHTEYGPAPLFDTAREQLKGLAGPNLEIPHAQARLDEREVPLQYLTDFQPECWEVVVVETSMSTGRITYMSLRRKLESDEYLWIVLAHEHVITGWVTRRPSNRAAHPLNVKDGPAWNAAADGRDPAITGAMAEWADAYARRVRAHRVLAALATVPERPSGDRLAQAAGLVLEGRSWNEAGWEGRSGLDAAIMRLLRAVSAAVVPWRPVTDGVSGARQSLPVSRSRSRSFSTDDQSTTGASASGSTSRGCNLKTTHPETPGGPPLPGSQRLGAVRHPAGGPLLGQERDVGVHVVQGQSLPVG